mmetsp:Transcript_83066/g.101816  ORF Transcript_83066/g.101816 Transcript_83066/m.101816 type:complete len:90 (+) Transcript_83066:40-309(+)
MENSQYLILVILIAALVVLKIIHLLYSYHSHLFLSNQIREMQKNILVICGHLRSNNIEARDEQKGKEVASRTNTPTNTPTGDDDNKIKY